MTLYYLSAILSLVLSNRHVLGLRNVVTLTYDLLTLKWYHKPLEPSVHSESWWLTSSDGWRHKEVHQDCPEAVSEQSDVRGIPAERTDIFLYPVKCCHLVEQCVVTRSVAVSGTQESYTAISFYYRTMLRRARLCHSESSVCLSVRLLRWGMIFTQVEILRK